MPTTDPVILAKQQIAHCERRLSEKPGSRRRMQELEAAYADILDVEHMAGRP